MTIKPKFKCDGFYDAEHFWGERFALAGLALKGPGNWGLSEQVNAEMYQKAKEVFLGLCAEKEIELTRSRVLEIGTGNGFYASVLKEAGVGEYLGVDITDVLFDRIRPLVPGLEFMKLDIAKSPPPGKFDLIFMIDVTQHIASDADFSNAMQNIRSSLVPGGLFFVTSLLEDRGRISFHQRFRGMDAFEREFQEEEIGAPIPFRDKYIFSIQMKPAEDIESPEDKNAVCK